MILVNYALIHYVLRLGIIFMVAHPLFSQQTAISMKNTHAKEAIFTTPPGGDVSTPFDVSRDLLDDNVQ